MPEPLSFERNARRPVSILVLALVYVGLIAAVVVLQAAPWLMAILALFTLPAAWDIGRNARAGLNLDDHRLRWFSGRREGELALSEIDHMRFDTRWDFSVRVSAVLAGDKRVRLPYEALPPHRALEAAFEARGVTVTRHHFTVF